MPLSPAAAAKIAGVSRSLISKEIKAGNLAAVTLNNGHKSIEKADLDAWMARRTERAIDEPGKPVDVPIEPSRVEALEKELAAVRQAMARLEGQAEVTAARIADLTSDRDRWRDQAERLAERPSLFARLFGR